MDLPRTKEELYGRYYLKNDLLKLCKENSLPTTGSKENLLKYICEFIEGKSVVKAKTKSKNLGKGFEPLLEKTIDENYSNNEIHRRFLLRQLGSNLNST